MRGHLDKTGLEQEYQLVRNALAESGADHLREFSDAWVG